MSHTLLVALSALLLVIASDKRILYVTFSVGNPDSSCSALSGLMKLWSAHLFNDVCLLSLLSTSVSHHDPLHRHFHFGVLRIARVSAIKSSTLISKCSFRKTGLNSANSRATSIASVVKSAHYLDICLLNQASPDSVGQQQSRSEELYLAQNIDSRVWQSVIVNLFAKIQIQSEQCVTVQTEQWIWKQVYRLDCRAGMYVFTLNAGSGSCNHSSRTTSPGIFFVRHCRFTGKFGSMLCFTQFIANCWASVSLIDWVLVLRTLQMRICLAEVAVVHKNQVCEYCIMHVLMKCIIWSPPPFFSGRKLRPASIGIEATG